MRELYAPFNRSHDRTYFTDVRSAELIKYAANAMLATKISFMNEMANIAERLGADIEEVRKGIGADPRIGYHFIYPGCGYGGSCFPKDVRALIHSAQEVGFEATLLAAVEDVNQRQKEVLFEKVQTFFGDVGSVAEKTIAVWGLSFKPNTDDMREAPSRVVLDRLLTAGYRVRAFDPVAGKEAARLFGDRDNLTITATQYDALADADALVICTEWGQFRAPDFSRMEALLKRKVIFDGRNLYDPKKLSAEGWKYFSVGRGNG